ncbi:MAG: aldehyde reductase [Bacteroidota bacterium]
MNPQVNAQPILVTGGSGFIASWIVKMLLEKGHTVHATVRSKAKTQKYQHLEEIAANSSGSLKIFEADLLKEGSFAEAMAGCGIVMHTASPFVVQGVKNGEEELVKPALLGTRNVLNSATTTPTVQRIVLTSSVVALYGDASEGRDRGGKLDESMWNATSSVKNGPYNYSKTVAEKEAWKVAETQTQWDLVTINPSFVLGPSLTQNSNSASLTLMKQIMDGTFKSGVPELYFGVVDVRDVAQAHLEAAFRPTAQGRHIVSNEASVSMLDIADFIREKYGTQLKLPKSQLPKFMLYLLGPFIGFTWKYVSNNVGIALTFENQKAKSALGMTFRSPKEAVQAHAESMIAAGVVALGK